MIPHSRPWISDEDRCEVADALASGFVARGARVSAFEKAVAAFCALSGGVAVSCGTAALELALRALRLAPQREVIIPTYVCRDVYAAVVAAGLVPVVCDVGVDGLIDEAAIARRLSSRTGAVIVVHLFGRVADTSAIAALGVPVVEDACQAFGAEMGAGPPGAHGVIRVFSFHGTKCLTTGEGGMVVASDPDVVMSIRALRDGEASVAERVASPMSDIQAALGTSQLRRYPTMLARRRAIAERYNAALAGCDVVIDSVDRIRTGAAFRFAVRSGIPFATVESAFSREGVTVRRGVDALIHRLLGDDTSNYPIAEMLFTETASVPLYPSLSDEEIERVASTLPRVFGSPK